MSPAAKKSRPRARPAARSGEETLHLSRLEQVRVLADPLRLRMLELFGQAPRTTKQVAELLGEKPTRLYHHVDAMVRVGLIELQETRQNRGATEKYYRAASRRFEVGNDPAKKTARVREQETVAMIRTLLDATSSEVIGFFGRPDHERPPVAPLLARAAVRATPEKLEEIRQALLRILEMRGPEAAAKDESATTYSLAVFYYPRANEQKPKA